VNLFINYFRSNERSTCLNLAVARFVICCYGAWKVASYPFLQAASFPDAFLSWNPYNYLSAFCLQSGYGVLLEQGVAVVLLIMCALGFARGVSSFGAAFLLTHMEGVCFAIENQKTATNLAFFFILYCIFRRADSIGLDDFLASRRQSPDMLNKALKENASSHRINLETLKWFLLTLALIYFFTGFSKWQAGDWSLAWGSPENLRLAILNNALGRTLPISPLGEFLAGQPLLLGIAGYGTLFLELGFLIAVLARFSVTPFLLGLAGMHAVIRVAMNVNYFTDMVFLYMAFVAWDSLAEWMQRGRILTVVYDEKCPFCMRTLLMLKKCDVAGGLRFVGSSDSEAPVGYDYASALFVFDQNDRAYEGYDGFVAMISYLGITRPLAWIMAFPPLAMLGRRIYKRVAQTRSCASEICDTRNHQAKS